MYTTRAFCKLKKAVYLDTSLYHYVLDRAGSIMNVTKGERMFWDEIPFWRADIMEIDKVYHSAIVSKGDFARMKLFLFCPPLYALTVHLYNKIVIPLRRGRYITVRRNNAF